MKEYLIYLDNTKALGGKFIIEVLDENRLFIRPEILDKLLSDIDELMDIPSGVS